MQICDAAIPFFAQIKWQVLKKEPVHIIRIVPCHGGGGCPSFVVFERKAKRKTSILGVPYIFRHTRLLFPCEGQEDRSFATSDLVAWKNSCISMGVYESMLSFGEAERRLSRVNMKAPKTPKGGQLSRFYPLNGL